MSDIQSVWHPTLSIEAYQVGESSAGVEERLETVLSEEKFEVTTDDTLFGFVVTTLN